MQLALLSVDVGFLKHMEKISSAVEAFCFIKAVDLSLAPIFIAG